MSEVAAYKLPSTLFGHVDLARLVQDLEMVDNDLASQRVKAKSAGHKVEYHMPPVSQALDDFIDMNDVDLAKDGDRSDLIKQLKTLKNKAPIMHLTFPASVDAESLGKLIKWVRDNLHPQALVNVGVQPDLIGGVYVRTPNKVFDYSLRSKLATGRDIITKELGALK